MTDKLDLPDLAQHLRQHVEMLAKTPRTPGTREHRQAADYIRYHLEQAGLAVQEAPFRRGRV